MNATASWGNGDPRDSLTRDELLVSWQKAKDAVDAAKEYEMDLRKYISNREFPDAKEGTNNKELGNGYKLKTVKKLNYNLKAPVDYKGSTVDAVDDCIDNISKILPNEGPFITERLFNWKVDLSISEYRKLQEESETFPQKKKVLDEVNKVLEIKEAAPTLEIVEPKNKR